MNDLNTHMTDRTINYEIDCPTIEDIPQLLDLWRQQYEYHHNIDPVYYASYSGDLNDRIRRYLEKTIQEDEDQEQILVAKDGNSLVGFITFTVGDESYFDSNIIRYGELKELLVTEGVRGTGVGGALVKAVEKRFRSLGVPFAVIKCSSFNTNALAVYEKLGYTTRQEILYKPL